MNLTKLVEAIDAQVVAGDIIGAFDQFAADNCITHSNPSDITHTKAEKLQGLEWFMSNIAHQNNIERAAFVVVGDNETHSQFQFDFTNNYGEQLLYSEVIRRVWKDDKLVEEQYLLGATLPTAPVKEVAKKAAPTQASAKADAKPANAATEKKAAPAKKVATKDAAPKADDLTIVEGIGPKIAELLIKGGIVTFADLAKAKPAAIKTILDAAGKRFQMHDPATWPKQAELARDGKTAELQKLQDELKGGKN